MYRALLRISNDLKNENGLHVLHFISCKNSPLRCFAIFFNVKREFQSKTYIFSEKKRQKRHLQYKYKSL